MTNRELMPNVAAIVDELFETFGPVKVKWAKEGDREMGKRDPWAIKLDMKGDMK